MFGLAEAGATQGDCRSEHELHDSTLRGCSRQVAEVQDSIS